MSPEINPEDGPTPEIERPAPPRIYVASLSDYNAGRLHGAWIDASQELDEVWQQVTEMLAASSEPIAEEWAIHDFDNFGPLRLNEYESLGTVVGLAQGIEEHGEPYALLAANLDRSEWSLLDRFEELYLGQWSSDVEYAEGFLEDIGIDIDEIGPEMLQPYITVDLDAFARDLSDDYLMLEAADGSVHVFQRD